MRDSTYRLPTKHSLVPQVSAPIMPTQECALRCLRSMHGTHPYACCLPARGTHTCLCSCSRQQPACLQVAFAASFTGQASKTDVGLHWTGACSHNACSHQSSPARTGHAARWQSTPQNLAAALAAGAQGLGAARVGGGGGGGGRAWGCRLLPAGRQPW